MYFNTITENLIDMIKNENTGTVLTYVKKANDEDLDTSRPEYSLIQSLGTRIKLNRDTHEKIAEAVKWTR